MGRTNRSYNGMLSAIARKSLPRFVIYEKDWISISDIFGNGYPNLNKRGNDSMTNIVSIDFNTSEDYIKNQTTLVGKIYIDSDDFLSITGITSLDKGVSYTLYFSSEYGTKVALSLSLNGEDYTEGVTKSTDTSLTFTLSKSYLRNYIYIKSLDAPNIGRSISVIGGLEIGTIYFVDGILKVWEITTLAIGQPYTFYFSKGDGNQVLLALTADGDTFEEGVTSNTATSLSFTLPATYSKNNIYIKSRTTEGIGSSLDVTGTLATGTVYFVDGILNVAGISTLAIGQPYTFNFSAGYGTQVLLALTADGDTFEEGVTSNTATSLSFTLPATYGKNNIYIKSRTTEGIGSSLNVTGTPTTGTVYFVDGILNVAGISTLAIGQPYTFNFSAGYGTQVLLALTADGDTFEEGVTSNTATSLSFTLPATYSKNNIYIKSRTTEGIGSSLDVTGTLATGTVYFVDGILNVAGISTLAIGQPYTFNFSAGYGTQVLLALTADGDTFEEGVTSNTATSLSFTLPATYGKNNIYIKSRTTEGIGSSLNVTGTPTTGTVYFVDGILNVAGISTLAIGQPYTFNFSAGYGTQVLLALTADGDTFEEGVTSNTATSLSFTLPATYGKNNIYIKSRTTEGIGSSLDVTGTPTTGTVYFVDGILNVAGITTLTRGEPYTFNFSQDYGTQVLLALTADGDTFEEGVTSNTATSLSFTLPATYGKNNIYIKSRTTEGIGSSLDVTGAVTPNYVYFDDNGQITISGVTKLFLEIAYQFYFSQDYGTEIFLSQNGTPPAFTNGVSNTSTSISFTLTSSSWPGSYIYIASPTNYQTVYRQLAVEDKPYASSWTLKDTISKVNTGFAFYGSESISGDGAWISIGAEGSTTELGNVFIYSKNTDITYSETQDILSPDNIYLYGNKTKISRDGNYLCIIKKLYNNPSGFQMFERTNTTWSSFTSLINFDYVPNDVALSEDGTYIVISNNYNVDEVKVYIKSANDSSVTLKTTINPPENSFSGAQSVSISDNGEILCFGTPFVEGYTGNVYVYTSNDSWTSNTYTVLQPSVTAELFGFDVSISGDGNFIAVGALGSDRVYIYKRSGTSWSLSSTINGPSGYGFGTSVSLSQNGYNLAVGSVYQSGVFIGDHVYAYYRDVRSDAWTLAQTIAGDTGTAFGLHVNISSEGNYILVTADQATANAYVYYGT
jgi:hypothetical protein